MKNSILFAFCFGFIGLSFGQQKFTDVAVPVADANWWKMKQNTRISTEHFMELFQKSNPAAQHSTFKKVGEKQDEFGMTHTRLAQYQNGVKVEGAQLLLHGRNGLVQKVNGRLVTEIKTSAQPKITFSQALEKTKTFLNTPYFYFESADLEAWIKSFKNDPSATFYPAEELVYIDPNFGQHGENYQLAFKIDVYFDAVLNHATVFVNAQTGVVVFKEEGCHSTVANGLAYTKYHGIRDIKTDSVNATKYVLLDATRGGGIETYNNNNQTNYANAQFFEDSNNIWNNFNAQLNEVGTDVHWATGEAYDYYLNFHNRNSFDDLGTKLVSYVHFDNNYFNAFWNGLFMTYGDGNGNPLTSIDVIGHELTHGVTEYTADLVYAYEPGALNESFSDIFGTHLEFNSLGDTASWKMGILDFQLRDMSNPNAFNDPDTYNGSFWHTAPSDNGGVHINSGVQNYWYYLLSVGKSGTNDLGNAFTVDSIGMISAAQIAYRNLAYYLTPTSQYFDARQGSIEAAEDIFGNCAPEVIATAKAWYAVGVGPNTTSADVEMLEALSPVVTCKPTSQEPVEIQFTFHESGCNDSIIPVGDTLQFTYIINNGTPVVENLIVSSPIQNNDTLSYSFTQPADLSVPGNYIFKFSMLYKKDVISVNNQIQNYQVASKAQLAVSDSFTFENNRNLQELPYYALITRENSVVERSFYAKNKGLNGLLFSGLNPSVNIDSAANEADNFILNPEYQADFCSCIDARTWDFVTLSFDLKQTYSGLYQVIGLPMPPIFASSLRVVVNGQQVGSQYHPTTLNQDPFVRQFVVLDNYAGQEFELCFQGKHFIDRQSDFTPTEGDNSYVDNINIEDEQFFSVPEFEAQDIQLQPNPSNGLVTIAINSFVESEVIVKVMDNLGRVVYADQYSIGRGQSNHPIQLEVAAGIYMVQLELNGQILVKKLVVN